MPPKSKPKKSTPPPKASKPKRAPPAAAREPEVLNERTVAADQAPVRAAPMKSVSDLDDVVAYVGKTPGTYCPIREAIEKTKGGAWSPDREISVLRLIKEDGRLTIINRDKVNLIGLTAEVGSAPKEAAPAKTLGEHVADAKDRPQHVPWQVTVGSPVLLLTDGQPDKKATIRNIHNHGTYALYDLNLAGGGGTIDGLAAFRIGRDIEREGEVEYWRLRCGALERHCSRGAELAQQIAARGLVAKQLADSLLKEKHAIAELEQQLAQHATAQSGQTDLRDLVGGGEAAKPAPGPGRGEKMKAPPKASEDKLAEAPAKAAPGTRDVVELEATGLSMDQLQAAAVNQSTASTGKPQPVKPVKPKGMAEHVLGHVQAGVAVLLPLYSKQEWVAEIQGTYGFPLDVPNAERPVRLAKGGVLNGMPVRVGRTPKWIGPETCALLVRLPPLQLAPEPEAKAVGKDAAAGN